MKQKLTIKTFFIALAAVLMSCSVILSSAHAKDIVRVSGSTVASSAEARSNDVTAKVFGELHNHIDKQMVKNISMDNPMTAREREIKALNEAKSSRTIPEILEETFAYSRFAFSTRLSLALA